MTLHTGALWYFVLVHGWSWLCWLAHIHSHGDANPASSPLFLIGGAGPVLTAVALTHLRERPEVRRSFWIRALDPRRIRGRWWAAALLLHPTIIWLSMAADVGLGGAVPALSTSFQSIGQLVSLAGFVFWFGPLPEEIGWRGFALDRLRLRLAALPSNLLLGAIWALWHVPLFFVPGTFQAELGFGTARSLIFLCSMVPLSVLIGWIYDNTSRSSLSAALVHFSGNMVGAIMPKSGRAAAVELALLCLVAVYAARQSRLERVAKL